jgi:hypothetical protein
MMRTYLTGAAFLLGALLLPTGPVGADIAPLTRAPLFGEGPLPGTETAVRLDEEKVSLKVSPDRTRVDALFYFQNTGLAETLVVGFPAYARFHDFRVWADGAPVAVRRATAGKGELRHGPLTKRGYRQWLVWTLSFPPGVRRTLRLTYWHKPLKRDFTVEWPGGKRTSSACWNGPEEGKILDRLTRYSTGYVLTTGAGWRGTIRRAVVELRLEGMTNHVRNLAPSQGLTLLPHGARWEFLDFEPTLDIHISYNPSLTLNEEIDLFEKIAHPSVSPGTAEYFWRPFHLARLYRARGGDEERTAELFRQVIVRFWPRREIRKPLKFGGRQFTALVTAMDELMRHYIRTKKADQARAFAKQALGLLRIIALGGAVHVAGGRHISTWGRSHDLAVLAAKLAELCADFLDPPDPAPTFDIPAWERKTGRAWQTIREALVAVGKKGAAPWRDLVDRNPAAAVVLARHVIATLEARATADIGARILRKVKAVNTKDAMRLIVEVMALPDHRFDTPNRAALFSQLLRTTKRLLPLAGKAALKKLDRLLARGWVAPHYLDGYAEVAARHAPTEAVTFFKALLRGKHGKDARLRDAGFRALCGMKSPPIIDYLLSKEGACDYVLASDLRVSLLIQANPSHALARIQDLLRKVADPRLRRHLAFALGRSGKAELIGFFEELCRSQNGALQVAGLQALGMAYTFDGRTDFYPRARTLLSKALQGDDSAVRAQAYRAYAGNNRLKSRDLQKVIEGTAKNETDPPLRRAAEHALRKGRQFLSKRSR